MVRIVNICPLWVLQRRGPDERVHGGYKRCSQQHLRITQTPELPLPAMKLFLLLLCREYPLLGRVKMLGFATEGWDGRLLFPVLLTPCLQWQGWLPPTAAWFSSVQ